MRSATWLSIALAGLAFGAVLVKVSFAVVPLTLGAVLVLDGNNKVVHSELVPEIVFRISAGPRCAATATIAPSVAAPRSACA